MVKDYSPYFVYLPKEELEKKALKDLKTKKTEMSPLSGSEPKYEPKKWNSNSYIKKSHNCYIYSYDDISNNLIDVCKKGKCSAINPQPGHYSGIVNRVDKKRTNCKDLIRRTISDNPSVYQIDFD